MPDPTLVTPALLREWALPDAAGGKRGRGQLLVVGGAAGTPGGVALAGMAALRVGAGHVQLAVAESVAPHLAVAFPETGVVPLAQGTSGAVLGRPAAERCADLVGEVDAVLIGPGLDDADETRALLSGLLPQVADGVLVALDAYALGVLPDLRDLTRAHAGRLVLTPNGEELRRLVGDDRDPTDAGPEHAAAGYGACVTCQDEIADPEGGRWRVPSGHPGLATAGSGDVLAGLVGGLLARGSAPSQAACWATYLHSTAGERLASRVGGLGFLARELVDEVPAALAELS